MYSTDTFNLKRSNTFQTHLIIIINSEVSAFTIVATFVHGRVSEVYITSHSASCLTNLETLFFHTYCAV